MRAGKALLGAGGLLGVLAILAGACGSLPPSLDAGRALDAPAVYRVSTTTESRFSGPVSDLKGGTKLTAAFEATPVSGSKVEVEVLYLAASVRGAGGEEVALNLAPLAGKRATVEMGPPGEISEITGDSELLEAEIPLISVRETLWNLFPPLPGESMREDDTWTGDTPVPFPNLGDPPARMRYVVANVNPSDDTGRVEGYELRTGSRSFAAELPGGRLTGEGDLEITFEGMLNAGEGYEWTERKAEFDTRFLRIAGSPSYANGNLHMESETRVELLNSFEQFGLDPGANGQQK